MVEEFVAVAGGLEYFFFFLLIFLIFPIIFIFKKLIRRTGHAMIRPTNQFLEAGDDVICL
jgi:hypothetical protein